MEANIKYRRLPIEAEAPEQLRYERVRFNLAESSVRNRSLQDLGLKLDDMPLCYGDHLGYPNLRKLVAAQGDGLSEGDVLITAGASVALFIVATSILGKGDHIVVARPNYATNIETPRAIGCDISYLELTHENRYRVDIDELESMLRPETKYVSLTSPHNPSGAMLDRGELEGVIEMVTSKGCRLLLDETYREMAFGEALPVAGSLSPRVISVSSLSKTYGLPGIRIGWLVCQDKELMHLFLCAKEQISICGSVIDEAIASGALSQRAQWLPENNRRIRQAFDVVKDWMAHEELLEWIEPQGSCICFPRIRSDLTLDIDSFYRCLNDKYGVFVGPGHWFERSRRHFRLGYAYPAINELEGGLDGISKALREIVV
jgi:aspartate/methionine/tyrosine aminotransferase